MSLPKLKSQLLLSLKVIISVQLILTSGSWSYASENIQNQNVSTGVSSEQLELPNIEAIAFPQATNSNTDRNADNNAIRVTYNLPSARNPITVELTIVHPKNSTQVNQIGRWLENERQLNGMHPSTLNLKSEQSNTTAEHLTPLPMAYGEIENIEIPITAWEKFKFWTKEKTEKIHEKINLIDIRKNNLREQKIINKQTANDKLIRFLKAHPEGTTNGLAVVRAVGIGTLIYTAFTLSGSGEVGSLINAVALGYLSGAFSMRVDEYKKLLGVHDLTLKNISRLESYFTKHPGEITNRLSTSRTFDLSMQAIKWMGISAFTLVLAHLIFALTGEPLIPSFSDTSITIGISILLAYWGQGLFESAFTTNSREQNKLFSHELAKNTDPKVTQQIENERFKSDLATEIKFFVLALAANAGSVLANTHAIIQGFSSNHIGQMILGSLGVMGAAYFTHVLATYDEKFNNNIKIANKAFKNSCSAFFSATNEALDKAAQSQRSKSQ